MSCRPFYGHYTPMVALAMALQRDGHEVSFATAMPLDQTIRRDGFKVETVGLSVDQINEVRASDPVYGKLVVSPQHVRMAAFSRSFAAFEVPPRVQGLRRVIQRWHPHVMVHEMSEFAAPLAAALEDLPRVNHSFGPLVPVEVMAAAGRAAAEHWEANGLLALDRGGMYEGLYLDIAPPSLQSNHIASIPVVQPMRAVPLPPRAVEQAAWLSQLGKRPVVTVTFGTVYNHQANLFRAVIEGLSDIDADVVIATGRSEEARTLGALPANMQMHEWVPWTTLLERSSVVVSHGGASSTLGPLSFGLPLVLIPTGADHFTNADAASAAGVATVLDAKTVTPAGVRDAVASAFGEPARTAARRVANEIAEMPHPEAVVGVLAGMA